MLSLRGFQSFCCAVRITRVLALVCSVAAGKTFQHCIYPYLGSISEMDILREQSAAFNIGKKALEIYNDDMLFFFHVDVRC
jgi:hypothetical protein